MTYNPKLLDKTICKTSTMMQSTDLCHLHFQLYLLFFGQLYHAIIITTTCCLCRFYFVIDPPQSKYGQHFSANANVESIC